MSENAKSSYTGLHDLVRDLNYLSSAGSLLMWDEETYMPAGALDYRASQVAYLSGQVHQRFTAESTGDLIKACEDAAFAESAPEATNVREWRRQYDRAVKLPTEFVEEFERVTAHARKAWAEARKTQLFATFQPHLTRIVELSRQKADYLGYEDDPYDALLDAYEPGMRSAKLREVFAELREGLLELVPQAVEKSAQIAEDTLHGEYDVARQKVFLDEVLQKIGFDLENGRLDETTHPFCTTLGPRDIRLTTRYSQKDLMESLYCVLHEGGHGLYEQGLPDDHYGMPAGSSVSLGIHESQSRLWENKVGRTRQFWDVWLPRAQELMPGFQRFDAATVAAAINRVSPSFIRVEADEFTYDLHIILRFEIETKLISGELEPADVPGLWNHEFKAFLNLDVPNDSLGCLQDIHWSMGGLGYFPTYTLGNLNSAMLFEQAHEDLPDLGAQLGQGDYAPLLGWLREKVHRHGMRYGAEDLIREITGKDLAVEPHLRYLRSKLDLMEGET